MTSKKFRSDNPHAIQGLLLAIFFVSCIEVVAQTTYTWDGGGIDDLWSTASNWAGGVAPTDAAGSRANLIFGNAAGGDSVRDISASGGSGFNVDGITFNAGAGAFTLIRGTVTDDGIDMLGTRVADTWAPIVNESSNTQTIELNLISRSIDNINGISFDADSADIVVTSGISNFVSETDEPVTGNTEGGIQKLGAETLTLSGASTYDGVTLVEEGTLLINGDNSTATGDVTVESGATLGGTGIIGDATTTTTIETGAIHSPGDDSINGGNAIQRFGGDLSYNSGSSVLWELDANTTSDPGIDYDRIMVGGDLSFAASTTLDLSFNSLDSGVDFTDDFWSTYNIREWQLWGVSGGGATPDIGNITSLNISDDSLDQTFASTAPGNFYLFTSGNSVYLRYDAMPEPTTFGLLGLIMGGLTIFSRRRRRVAVNP